LHPDRPVRYLLTNRQAQWIGRFASLQRDFADEGSEVVIDFAIAYADLERASEVSGINFKTEELDYEIMCILRETIRKKLKGRTPIRKEGEIPPGMKEISTEGGVRIFVDPRVFHSEQVDSI
jgi:hypothetical protein